jgi:hypothetical protein
VLDIPETQDPETIMSGYRRRIRCVHPDVNRGADDRGEVSLLVRARTTLLGPDQDRYFEALLARRKARAIVSLRRQHREILRRIHELETRAWRSRAERDAYYAETEAIADAYEAELAPIHDIVGNFWEE